MDKTAVLALMVDDVDVRRNLILEYIQDEEHHSFEERKEVWLATPEHLYTTHNYDISLPAFEKKYGGISWYDDFYAEKESVVDLVQECKNAIEECESEDPDNWTHHYFISEEMLNDFIRACMDAGYHSFTHDW
jgi:hypothetical protein